MPKTNAIKMLFKKEGVKLEIIKELIPIKTENIIPRKSEILGHILFF